MANCQSCNGAQHYNTQSPPCPSRTICQAQGQVLWYFVMSNNCNTFLKLLVWLILIIEPPIKQIHNFVAHLNLKPTIVIKPQDKSLTEWTLRLVYCQAQFLVVEEVRAPQSPRVPRAKVPKVPRTKLSQNLIQIRA